MYSDHDVDGVPTAARVLVVKQDEWYLFSETGAESEREGSGATTDEGDDESTVEMADRLQVLGSIGVTGEDELEAIGIEAGKAHGSDAIDLEAVTIELDGAGQSRLLEYGATTDDVETLATDEFGIEGPTELVDVDDRATLWFDADGLAPDEELEVTVETEGGARTLEVVQAPSTMEAGETVHL